MVGNRLKVARFRVFIDRSRSGITFDPSPLKRSSGSTGNPVFKLSASNPAGEAASAEDASTASHVLALDFLFLTALSSRFLSKCVQAPSSRFSTAYFASPPSSTLFKRVMASTPAGPTKDLTPKTRRLICPVSSVCSTSSCRLPDVYCDSQIKTSVDIGLCLAQAPNACPRGTGDSVVVFRVRLVLYSCYDNRIPAREN